MRGAIEKVVAALTAADVRYLIVGGVAVVLHGHLRTTADLDLVVQLEQGNVARAVQALQALGYRPRPPVALEAFADSTTRERWMRDKNLTVLSLWSPSQPDLELDLFVAEPFDFGAVHGRALRVPLDTTEAMVIGLHDLITLKESVGRPRQQGWDRGWDEHRLRQATRGLELTPAERLRWLEETMETMRRWLGRAQQGRPAGGS